MSEQIYFFEQGAASLNSLNQYIDFSTPIEETFFEKRAPAIEFMKTLSLVVPLKIDPTSDPSARTGSPSSFQISLTSAAAVPSPPSSPLEQSTKEAKSRTLLQLTAMVRFSSFTHTFDPRFLPDIFLLSFYCLSFFSPPPEPSSPAAETSKPRAASIENDSGPGHTLAISVYPFRSETEGDLTFEKDEKIHILQKSENQEDWWFGRIGTREGYFPANYVRIV